MAQSIPARLPTCGYLAEKIPIWGVAIPMVEAPMPDSDHIVFSDQRIHGTNYGSAIYPQEKGNAPEGRITTSGFAIEMLDQCRQNAALGGAKILT
jgi:hypothetical protein